MTAAATCRNAEGKMEQVPESRINDGYCDCWETGEDEPTTDACSGIDYWGLSKNDETRCVAAGIMMTSLTRYARPIFQCPQQPELSFPVSRVKDGICDCCDGADEGDSSSCPDLCAEIKAAQAAKRAELQERYSKGSKIRSESIQAFQKLKVESELELKTLQSDLDKEQSNLDSSTDAFVAAKQSFVKQHVDRLKQSTANGIFSGLTNDELKQLIVHACQLSGEMSLKGSHCEALDLAALEVGLGLQKSLNDEDLADLVYYNAQNPDDRVLTISDLRKAPKKRRKKGRKLMRVVSAEEYPDDMEDYEEHFDDYSDDHHGSEEGEESNESHKSEERKAIEQLRFSESRVRFLSQAASLQKLLDEAKVFRDDKDASDNEVKSLEPEELERRSKIKYLVALDEKAFKLLKTTLEDRTRVVERGFNFAESGKSSIEELADSSLLEQIALGAVYHGKLSAVHVYQILSSILFRDNSTEQTCTNMAGMICPPKAMVRNSVTLPSKRITEAVTLYCDGASLPDQQGACVDDDAIPTEIADGYAGYYEVFPRDQDDEWHKHLEQLYSMTEQESAMLIDTADKESKAETAERIVKDLEKRIRDINDSIGTDDSNKFGPDGALHSIRSDCFTTKAGKYTYELCMYGKAAQKDGSSTNLGQWAGASVDDEEGHVWRWDGGAKCWNGPKRSATAYVTCGAETVVLSADEPDTCRYVLQVRSPIACDDSFRIKHDLV